MPKPRPKIKYEECLRLSKKCKNRWEFQKKYASAYAKCRKYWPKLIENIPKVNRILSEKYCSEQVNFYQSRKQLRETDPTIYWKIMRNWPKMIEHLAPDKSNIGWSKSDFVKMCNNKHDGLADFYLLHCYDDFESFYKFGITTNFKARYKKHKNLPYEYEIVNYFTAKSGFVWSYERHCISASKPYRYMPEIYFEGSLKECFKCRRNTKFLKSIS